LELLKTDNLCWPKDILRLLRFHEILSLKGLSPDLKLCAEFNLMAASGEVLLPAADKRGNFSFFS